MSNTVTVPLMAVVPLTGADVIALLMAHNWYIDPIWCTILRPYAVVDTQEMEQYVHQYAPTVQRHICAWHLMCVPALLTGQEMAAQSLLRI
jgi:hypothetical protein